MRGQRIAFLGSSHALARVIAQHTYEHRAQTLDHVLASLWPAQAVPAPARLTEWRF